MEAGPRGGSSELGCGFLDGNPETGMAFRGVLSCGERSGLKAPVLISYLMDCSRKGGMTQVTSAKTTVKRVGSWGPPFTSTARSWRRSSSLLMGIHHALLPASLPPPLLLASLGLSLPMTQ